MYVVARVSKTSRQLGGPVGPQHVAKTFVPYDPRNLTEEAAREFAGNLNYRYTPHIHGRTYVAVPAEPIPGGNKFRNLARVPAEQIRDMFTRGQDVRVDDNRSGYHYAGRIVRYERNGYFKVIEPYTETCYDHHYSVLVAA